MEYLQMKTLHDYLESTDMVKMYKQLIDKYKHTIDSLHEAEAETLMKRLEIMAYREMMYKYEKIPDDIAKFYPRGKRKHTFRYKNHQPTCWNPQIQELNGEIVSS